MKILGLTGGIGMGKSTAATAFRRAHIPVFDADAAVHRMQARGGRAVRAIEAAFPGTVRDGAVDRVALRHAVLGKPDALARLERILHPMVEQEEREFVARARRHGNRAVVLDIPLLFETDGDRRVDHVIVVTAPPSVQMQRIRRRRAHERRRHQGRHRAPDAGCREAPPRRYDHPYGSVAPSLVESLEPADQGGPGMTRAILFDTETTGLEPHLGHRVIEVAALELVNDLPTGKHFHALIHPERDIPEDATRIHGITLAHLADKPRFAEIVDELLAFFGEGHLIAHNAPFDFGFLNAELERLGRPVLMAERMIDTLALAKTRFPGMPNSLDALCRRFAIDLSARTTHNALLDCRLLADVYVELTGGRQRGFALAAETAASEIVVYTHDSDTHAAPDRPERRRTRRSRGVRRATEGSGVAGRLMAVIVRSVLGLVASTRPFGRFCKNAGNRRVAGHHDTR